jgi:hypothetical protein
VNRKPESERMAPATARELRELFAPGNAALAAQLRGLGYEDLPAWLTGSVPDRTREPSPSDG